MNIFGKITLSFWGAWLLACALGVCPAAAREGIAGTKHNLSASGPGSVKAPGASDDVCIFCHTPHNANPSRALWNQALPGAAYTLYTSVTLKATLQQPTGSSRLCLSCHDGTLALGNLRMPPSAGASTFGPVTGRASLGTDLSDDHPISFVYDTALALRRGELADPATLSTATPLDASQQLQCTTCHDPHDARYRQFLRMDDRFGALCTSCHHLKNWADSAHATSRAAWSRSGTNPWPTAPAATVAENACENCHRPHAAPRPAALLASAQEREVCLVCHNGSVAVKNVEPELVKFSAHPVGSSDWVHTPQENPSTMSRHVSCVDCHNPHQVLATAANPPMVSGNLQGVSGVDVSGAAIPEARYAYEVCLKCHGISDQTTPGIVRQDNTRNIRLEINSNNASYHPVTAVGRNPTIQGLEPGLSASSLIGCTDCHNNDDWTNGSVRPNGPHGSRIGPILTHDYQQGDPVTEPLQSYTLCYTCHTRGTLMASGRFPHQNHVENEQTSCAVCHDAHGSRQNPALINFMLRDAAGQVVVSPNRSGLIQFTSTGAGHGQCSLTCHGNDHVRQRY
ncbi:MAG: cytochrome c3 family protein [Candidatus Omnitrophica bacterium]|nr:cytochrome c3 family protein [Candidatus Omnitrophota bacterium]